MAPLGGQGLQYDESKLGSTASTLTSPQKNPVAYSIPQYDPSMNHIRPKGPGGGRRRRGWSVYEVRSDPCVPMGGAHLGHPQGTSHELPHHHRED